MPISPIKPFFGKVSRAIRPMKNPLILTAAIAGGFATAIGLSVYEAKDTKDLEQDYQEQKEQIDYFRSRSQYSFGESFNEKLVNYEDVAKERFAEANEIYKLDSAECANFYEPTGGRGIRNDDKKVLEQNLLRSQASKDFWMKQVEAVARLKKNNYKSVTDRILDSTIVDKQMRIEEERIAKDFVRSNLIP